MFQVSFLQRYDNEGSRKWEATRNGEISACVASRLDTEACKIFKVTNGNVLRSWLQIYTIVSHNMHMGLSGFVLSFSYYQLEANN